MESYNLEEYLRADAINYKPISNSKFSRNKLKALLFPTLAQIRNIFGDIYII